MSQIGYGAVTALHLASLAGHVEVINSYVFSSVVYWGAGPVIGVLLSVRVITLHLPQCFVVRSLAVRSLCQIRQHLLMVDGRGKVGRFY